MLHEYLCITTTLHIYSRHHGSSPILANTLAERAFSDLVCRARTGRYVSEQLLHIVTLNILYAQYGYVYSVLRTEYGVNQNVSIRWPESDAPALLDPVRGFLNPFTYIHTYNPVHTTSILTTRYSADYSIILCTYILYIVPFV